MEYPFIIFSIIKTLDLCEGLQDGFERGAKTVEKCACQKP